MAHLNKKCRCCQTRYSHCPDCSRADALKPSWASEFCSESCKDLWYTLTKWNMGMIEKSEAIDIISNIDLKSIDTYVDCVKRDYTKLMVEEKKPKRGKRAKAQLIEEAIDVPQEIIESVVESVAIEPTVHEVVLQEN